MEHRVSKIKREINNFTGLEKQMLRDCYEDKISWQFGLLPTLAMLYKIIPNAHFENDFQIG